MNLGRLQFGAFGRILNFPAHIGYAVAELVGGLPITFLACFLTLFD